MKKFNARSLNQESVQTWLF
uniref:Uncharacterized protein n=1 Tax=Rhizophora mucronata TaxID=61149 RepID=A0A2P2QXK0_RHIMU